MGLKNIWVFFNLNTRIKPNCQFKWLKYIYFEFYLHKKVYGFYNKSKCSSLSLLKYYLSVKVLTYAYIL